MESHTQAVSAHYDADDIAATILNALTDAGKNHADLSIEDFSAADEVHTRGREATVELSELARLGEAVPLGQTGELAPPVTLVDVGCGIGGPARYLASRFGFDVSGVDLTPGFCAAATELTATVSLEDRVRFYCASALEMPFADDRFDIAWTVQMQMNIADKPALYREINRVLKPGGRLVFQDIVQGTGGAVHLPVPWASAADHSHLALPEDLRQTIVQAGFREVVWRDVSEAHRDWTRRQAARSAPAPAGSAPAPAGSAQPAVGIHMVLGPDASEKRKNSARCLMEHRIGFVQGVFEKA